MKKNEPNYADASKRLSDEEIVDSFLFRSTLTKTEKAQADEEFLQLRLEKMKNKSEDQHMRSRLFRSKLLMQDYLNSGAYSALFSFSAQLTEYIGVFKTSKGAIAADLAVHPTKLSRIINGRENPNIDLMYRLEGHSGGLIPATLWYRLHARDLTEQIRKDKTRRNAEMLKVKNGLSLKKTG